MEKELRTRCAPPVYYGTTNNIQLVASLLVLFFRFRASILSKAFLKEKDMMELYKFVETKDYVGEILKQFDENWFFVDEKDVVRKIEGTP